jgi:hypothetical protein
MVRPDKLRLTDLRAAYRLIGECRELGRDPFAWRRHMLDGLRRLTGAQIALYLQIHHPGTHHETIAEPLDAGFLDEADRALWLHYQHENAHRDDPFHQRFFRGFTGALRTRRLESVVDGAEWRRSRHYNEYVRACRLEDRITSSVGLTPAITAKATQVIVLHRSAADGYYSRRDTRLVHAFHDELTGLLGRQLVLPGETVPRPLPIQLQHVLVCLLQGDAEKQVADRLGLSRHTVNRHVQRLHHHFAVHSRGELMHCCRDMLPYLLETTRESMQRRSPVRGATRSLAPAER